MKRWMVFLLCCSLLLVSADQVRLVSFDVINKSGDAVAIRMNGKVLEKFYYLRIPEGTRDEPAEANFTVAADEYTTQLIYLEPEWTIRPLRCKQPRPLKMNFNHAMRLVVLACVHEPVYTGEPFMLKAPIELTPY